MAFLAHTPKSLIARAALRVATLLILLGCISLCISIYAKNGVKFLDYSDYSKTSGSPNPIFLMIIALAFAPVPIWDLYNLLRKDPTKTRKELVCIIFYEVWAFLISVAAMVLIAVFTKPFHRQHRQFTALEYSFLCLAILQLMAMAFGCKEAHLRRRVAKGPSRLEDGGMLQRDFEMTPGDKTRQRSE